MESKMYYVSLRLLFYLLLSYLNIYSHSTEKINRTAADKLDAVLL